jgi:hypothetical protein
MVILPRMYIQHIINILKIETIFNRFAVKLYPKSAKLSHACIPNTRTIRASKGLEILATVPIKGGQPLTQLYGRIFKGTHRRQELLQNIYYFSCSCPRCSDPTELGTFFSAIKCSMKKCVGYLLPKTPLDISPTSKWKCNVCNNSATFLRCVVSELYVKKILPYCYE